MEQSKLKTTDNTAYMKQYYQDHKEEYKKKIICDICGGKYILYNKSHHKQLKKHKNAIEAIENEKIKKELEELKKKIKNLV